jgi:hypothetical protein
MTIDAIDNAEKRFKLNVKAPMVTVQVRPDVFAAAAPPPGVAPSHQLPERVQIAMDWAGGQVGGLNGVAPYGYSIYGGNDGWLGYPYLAQLTQRAEYRRPAEILAKEMTREWVKLKYRNNEKTPPLGAQQPPKPGEPADPGALLNAVAPALQRDDKLAKLRDAMEKFSVQKLFQQMVETEGYFGRAQLYIDIAGAQEKPGELNTPLIVDPRKIKAGSLRGFTLVEPFWTYPANYNSDKPLRPDFYQPQAWFVMGDTVHRSRMLTLVARPVPDILKAAYSFGGLSLSQMAKPYVDNWLRTRQSVSDLVHAFSTMVLSTDMSAEIEEGCDSSSLQNRAALFNLFRDNKGLMIVDKTNETLTNVAVPLGSLDELQAQSQEHMASVVGIPLVILLGVTPSGLNASSDGEVRTFYAWIKAQQEAHLSGLLRTALDIIQLSEFGEIDPNITFEWVPLWQVSEKEAAEIRKLVIEGDTALIDAGAVSPEEVRQKVANDEDMGYGDIDLSGPPPEPPVTELPDEFGGGSGDTPGDDEGPPGGADA